MPSLFARFPHTSFRAVARALVVTALACPGSASAFDLAVRADLATGSYPISVAAADLNADGWPDLVTANNTGVGVSVFLATGNGAFAAKVDYAAGTNPTAVAVADVTGDGILDLVAVNVTSPVLSVIPGLGNGTFGARVSRASAAQPMGIAIGDLNGDGRNDVVVANGTPTNTVSVYLANGTGGLLARTEYATGTNPQAVVLADFNGDGNLDVATPNKSAATLSVLPGTGTGALGARTDIATGTSPQSIAAGDLNNDGKVDVVVGNYSSTTVSVYPGVGTGSFGARTDFPTGAGPLGVAIGDIDGDGRADLAVCNYAGSSASVLQGLGGGTFGTKTDFAVGSFPRAVAIADMNGDGHPDLVLPNGSSNSLSMLMAAGAGGFPNEFRLVSPGTNLHAVGAADFDGDGRMDLVGSYTTTQGFVTVLSGQPEGTFGFGTGSPVYVTGSEPYRMAVGDWNGDGWPDLATASYDSSFAWVLLNNRAGAFPSRVSYPIGPYSKVMRAADVNADGSLDLVTLGLIPPAVSILLGSGTGTFGAMPDVAVPSSPVDMVVADVTGDGKPDVVTVNGTALSVLPGSGTGSFGTRTDYPVAAGVRALAAGDLNADGHPDIVVLTTASVSVMLNGGAGTFPAHVELPVHDSAFGLTLGDFNGDGRLDVVTTHVWGVSQHSDSTTLTVRLGDGAGGFGPAYFWARDGMHDRVIAMDLNGDGSTDLATNGGAESPIDFTFMPGLERTRVALSCSPSPSVAGSALTLTATVSVPWPGSGTPTGRVRFFRGTTFVGAAPLSGFVATLPVADPGPGAHAFSAVYSGDSAYLGAISPTRLHRVVASAKPMMTGLADVPADQGGKVRIRVRASAYDVAGSTTPIATYNVLRRIDTIAQPAAARRVAALRAAAVAPAGVLMDGWDVVGTFSATGDSVYNLVVATLADSNSAGVHRNTFFVRAVSTTPSVYVDSPADSGYSVDNLPPAVPAPFTAAYVAGATHLHWGANPADDFAYFRLYRASSAGFTPGPGNLLAMRADTNYVDTGAAGSWYKLSAVDVNGNESAVVTLGPGATTGVAPGVTGALALAGAWPNPSRGGTLRVYFRLASSAPATLELLDVGGRRLASRNLGGFGAGEHSVSLSPAQALAPGIYLMRLSQAGEVCIARASVID